MRPEYRPILKSALVSVRPTTNFAGSRESHYVRCRSISSWR